MSATVAQKGRRTPGAGARFRRALWANKLATVGAVYLVVLLATILLEPWLGLPAPTRMSLADQFLPAPSTCWARTRTAATCWRG